ncbi:ABC transporter substrate-binding protein [Salinarimonas sp. NSM]|uniref:ABC transporter substrate-binding protein n=1 Tax=Salinarimonas sp. NSM TaxID=3458003 RepID=UPI004036FE54
MSLRHLTIAAIAGAIVSTTALVAPASAQTPEGIYVPLLTYRTGAFAGSGIPIADGMHDYLTMLNERDGGIGGVPIIIEECETGYDTKRGVECYESVRAKNPVVVNPYSTGITLQLIPRAAVDGIPVLSMAYGLSASADGETFPWVFNPPVTYWDGASVFVKHIAEREGGFESLAGKTVGLLHLDAPYGREPIPVLEALAEEHGFELKLYPVAAQDMQNQGSVWLNIRRDRPDYIYLQGWGAMNPTAVREAIRTGFPIENMIGVWWAGGDEDARAGGADAAGYKALSFNGAGTDFPFIQDVITHVHDKGLSQFPRERVGDMLYNRGLYNSMLIAEAIRTAQEITGKDVVTGEDVRRGLENLNVSEERLAEMGMTGFAAPLNVTCENHSGNHDVFVAEWDGEKWTVGQDWTEPMTDRVRPLILAAAQEYASANAGWPQRTESCDN